MRRIDQRMASEATLLQTAAASIVSKEGGNAFRNLVKKLIGK